MAFTKITNAQLNSRGATTLPNQPTISATALKQEFDAPAKEIVAPAVNNLIDELEATTAAADVGAVAPTGRTGASVQALLNDISDDLAAVELDIVALDAAMHTHDNKALLDSYDQTNADIAQAVADDHTHSNKSLLDDYTQTETDLADAVSKKHEHSNKGQLDKITEGGGKPLYDGKDISGSIDNSFKTIKIGNKNLVASGEDTFELIAGDNITFLVNETDKTIEVVSAGGGGGGGGGDMLQSVYDTNKDGIVNAADTLDGLTASVTELNYVNGVTSDIQDQLDAKANSADLADVATSGSYSDLDDTPTVDQLYDGTSQNAQSGVALAGALFDKCYYHSTVYTYAVTGQQTADFLDVDPTCTFVLMGDSGVGTAATADANKGQQITYKNMRLMSYTDGGQTKYMVSVTGIDIKVVNSVVKLLCIKA